MARNVSIDTSDESDRPRWITGGLPSKSGSIMDVWMPWRKYGGDGKRPDDNDRHNLHRGRCSQLDALRVAEVRFSSVSVERDPLEQV